MRGPFGILGVSLGRSFLSVTLKWNIQKFLIMINIFFFPWEEIPGSSEADGKGKGGAASWKRSVSLGKWAEVTVSGWSLKGRVLLRPVHVTINSHHQVTLVNFCYVFCTENSSAFRLLSCLSRQLVSLFMFFSCVLSWVLFLKIDCADPFPRTWWTHHTDWGPQWYPFTYDL